MICFKRKEQEKNGDSEVKKLNFRSERNDSRNSWGRWGNTVCQTVFAYGLLGREASG